MIPIRPRHLLAVALAALGGCDLASPTPFAGGPGSQGADAARIATCRDRSDATYRAQNRGTIFTGTDQRDSPLSANYVSGNTARGLGDAFARDNAYDDCLRAGGVPSPAPSRVPSLNLGR